MVSEVHDAAATIAVEDRVEIDFERIWSIDPIVFDEGLVDLAEEVTREVTGTSARLFSGALHDAAAVAASGVPTVMLFVQSAGGISHAREEDTAPEHLEAAVGDACAADRAGDRARYAARLTGARRAARRRTSRAAAAARRGSPGRTCSPEARAGAAVPASSMPSATVTRPSACASDTIAPAIDAPWSSSPSAAVNDRSIFSMSSGKRCRCASDE